MKEVNWRGRRAGGVEGAIESRSALRNEKESQFRQRREDYGENEASSFKKRREKKKPFFMVPFLEIIAGIMDKKNKI